jgi:hypothetical protein
VCALKSGRANKIETVNTPTKCPPVDASIGSFFLSSYSSDQIINGPGGREKLAGPNPLSIGFINKRTCYTSSV